MANFTRRAIKEAFTSLLEERPLNDITVKDIVERCGINRNSFYYHYPDIPALAEEIVRDEAARIVQEYPSLSSRPTPPYPPLWRALMRSSNLPHAAAGPFCTSIAP